MNKELVELKEQLHAYDEKYPRNTVKEATVACNKSNAMHLAIAVGKYNDLESKGSFEFELVGRIVKVMPSYGAEEKNIDLFVKLKLTF